MSCGKSTSANFIDPYRVRLGGNNPDAVLDSSMVRPLPQVPASLPLPDALSRLRRDNSHLALVTDERGAVSAMVALEDLVEDLVGAVRDGTHRG